ncbi:GntR family transcriptional regulator [Lysinibacillus macroides]|uniref:Transcriptional regulator n=1 Tax=Lysinibacillus macroides TaxID=33935 RepID=A0A0N0CWX8_9BACI|nr:GntR family transcriptional regulator [Lysinibacillus macroides]KOY83514.1 transcriptional regulator [Lysinibacillus macroides]QPR69387.1 GntR family transcriptional regulator [Lysinibacillus macroides]
MKRPTEIAYEFIKERILEGIYQPSQKLIENDLSLEIGVSRNTVKKALLKLEQENLVVLEKNKGATIKSFSLDEINNFLKIREVLEGLIASDAAQNITAEDLQKLDTILMEMKSHLQNHDFDAYSQSNLDFHEVIYNASHNQQAVDMVKIIKQQLKRLQFKTILVPGRNENSLEEHRHILEALQNHDAEQAENYLKRHVENIRHTILNNYNVLL